MGSIIIDGITYTYTSLVKNGNQWTFVMSNVLPPQPPTPPMDNAVELKVNGDPLKNIVKIAHQSAKLYYIEGTPEVCKLTIEYCSRDQRANCNIFAQEGTSERIAQHYVQALTESNARGAQYAGMRYDPIIEGVPCFSQFTNQTSEGVRVDKTKPNTRYYFIVSNTDPKLDATILLFSTRKVL